MAAHPKAVARVVVTSVDLTRDDSDPTQQKVSGDLFFGFYNIIILKYTS